MGCPSPPTPPIRPPSGSATPASSTNQTPPGNCSRSSAATASASRVLPTPPDPVSVTSRSSPTSSPSVGDVDLPSDERRELDREVVTVHVERAQRRHARPVDQDGPPATRARDGRGPSAGGYPGRRGARRRPAVDDQPGGRVRHEDLITVPDRSKASASDHGLTEVVALVAQLGLAGVDRHAHVEVSPRRPGLRQERSLRIDRRRPRHRTPGRTRPRRCRPPPARPAARHRGQR